MSQPTIFKRIIDKEIPADIVYEDDTFLAFRDINAKAPTHVLIIPKKEIARVSDLTDADAEWMGRLWLVVRNLAEELGLDNGYRVVDRDHLGAVLETGLDQQDRNQLAHARQHVVGGQQGRAEGHQLREAPVAVARGLDQLVADVGDRLGVVELQPARPSLARQLGGREDSQSLQLSRGQHHRSVICTPGAC